MCISFGLSSLGVLYASFVFYVPITDFNFFFTTTETMGQNTFEFGDVTMPCNGPKLKDQRFLYFLEFLCSFINFSYIDSDIP